MQSLTAHLHSSTTNAAPQIDVYLASEPKTDIGIIILPGGGYRKLAEHEGKAYAEFFQQHGISCFVVNYRLGPQGFKHPAMLEDALAAIETMREKSTELDIKKLGIMGSSAGGHLAAHSITAYQTYSSPYTLRADFAILCYPVVSMSNEFTHAGSCEHLLGSTASTELKQATSPELNVSTSTPPCFIWHTLEDASVAVENSFLFAQALRDKGCSLELHIYAKGPHALGLKSEFTWYEDCLRWLKTLD